MNIFKNKIFLGSVCMLLAAVISFAVLPRFYASRSETMNVVRVTQDIGAGTVITRAMVTTSEVGAYGVSEKVVKSESKAIGYVATADLFAGEYLSEDRILSADDYDKYMKDKTKGLKPGEYLVTLEFPSASSGIASVLRAGAIVDVYEAKADEEKNIVVEKRLSNMSVFDVLNKDLDSLKDLDELKEKALDDTKYDLNPSFVVFRCNQEQAEQLIRLEKEKTLHLTLVKTEG